MVKIRLKRIGKKKHPFYRIVVIDSRAARNSRNIEEIGTYDPTKDPSVFDINSEKVKEWIRKGAQMTETVSKIVKIAGIKL